MAWRWPQWERKAAGDGVTPQAHRLPSRMPLRLASAMHRGVQSSLLHIWMQASAQDGRQARVRQKLACARAGAASSGGYPGQRSARGAAGSDHDEFTAAASRWGDSDRQVGKVIQAWPEGPVGLALGRAAFRYN